jgi:hypothetical protein
MAKARRSSSRSGSRPRAATPAHDTPVLGPRRRPTKVRPLSPEQQRRGATDDPGAPPSRPEDPRKDPWIDEGEPEVNG